MITSKAKRKLHGKLCDINTHTKDDRLYLQINQWATVIRNISKSTIKLVRNKIIENMNKQMNKQFTDLNMKIIDKHIKRCSA